MHRSKIEWVLNPDNKTLGWVWNPLTGCLNHDNGLCKGGGFPCYAYKLANGRLKQRYLANHNMLPFESMQDEDGSDHWQFYDPFYPRFWYERVREEFGAKTAGAIPKGIFVCDMSDLFGQGIPEQWTRRVLSHIGMSWYSEHRFYLLTKQPQNLIKFSPFPENCWVGVTATNAKMADDAGYYFQRIDAEVRFLSLEPLLEPMQLFFSNLVFNKLDWLIIGACTGSLPDMNLLADRYPDLWLAGYKGKITAQPRIEWLQQIELAAKKAGIMIFEKDNLQPLLKRDLIQEVPCVK